MFSNRILRKTASNLVDLSTDMNNYLEGSTVVALLSSEYLYIGSDLPFNHRYFDMKVPNAALSTMSVELFDGGNQWFPAIEVVDDTKVSGATLGKSGIVSWVPDRTRAWGFLDSTERVDALKEKILYNLYWARFKVSVDLSAETEINFIGHKFSNDTDLFAQYPDLARPSLMNAFKTGKNSWHEQHLIAAEYLCNEMMNKGFIRSKNQILEWEVFRMASIHRVATLIYSSFGKTYEDQLKAAWIEYKKASNIRFTKIDCDANATLDEKENRATTVWMSR